MSNSPEVQKAMMEAAEEILAMAPKEFDRELELIGKNPINDHKYEDGLTLDSIAMLRES